jgi:hypothetical protein
MRMAALTTRLGGTFLGLCLAPLVVGARPLPPEAVPAALQPWVPWVLHGHDERRCPLVEPAHGVRRCGWPTRLALDLERDGGTFLQTWRVYAPAWVRLPGDARHWPQGVDLDGAAAAVVEHDGRPALWVGPGAHQARGRLEWSQPPEALQLPAELALLSLSVAGEPVLDPQVEPDGRLWLKGRGPAEEAREGPAETLDARVFRRLIDDVPFEVLTRIDLEVSGGPREVLLGPALIEAASIPLAIESPLPARLEPDGRLRLQVRPGRWSVTLTARSPGPVREVVARAAVPPWPGEEVWVLDARPQLRLVEPEGLDALDPTLTSLPPDWHGRPTYRARPGERLRLVERRRGDPEPEPDRLALARTLWLDFDGAGATVRDQISGVMSGGWRLEAAPPLHLGRVSVDGEDRLVTRLSEDGRAGVEVRRGQLEVVADSRLDGPITPLPAAGWTRDFQRVSATVNLPPGWRLLAATGVDQVRHAWLTRWTLFDLFVLLLASTAVGRLWGWAWGGAALGAFGLGYQEPGMPFWPWLVLLGAVALLRALPSGRLRVVVQAVRRLSLLVLVLLALPFLVQQVRVALFPALERPWQVVADQPPVAGRAGQAADALAEAPATATEGAPSEEPVLRSARPRPSAPSPAPASKARVLAEHDPTAAVQAGPGLPRWSWEGVQLGFNGPVAADASVRLVLLPPAGTRAWRLLTVGLLAALLARALLPWRATPRQGVGLGPGATAVLALAAVALWPAAVRAEFPSPGLLEDLRERLLAPPECVPRCVESPRMRLEAVGDRLTLRLEVVAQADAGVPLPHLGRRWSPGEVLLDGEPAPGLARDPAGVLWLAVPEGVHQVLVQGPLARGKAALELSLPLTPRRVEAVLEGWRLEGRDPDGVPQAVLRLAPEQAAEPAGQVLVPGVLPSFLRVERTLRLGLEWQVETRVVRVSPPGAAVVAEIPLLAGESVTTPGVRVEAGRAQVSLAPEEREGGWSSALARAGELALLAPDASAWTEVWRLDLGPSWHATFAGIPPVYPASRARWLPEWRPWPGEGLVVRVSRPEGVVAPTLTLEGAELRVRPGERLVESELELRTRSTQGGQSTVGLPDGAALQSATVDGVAHPVRQDAGRVVLPVRPGEQRVALVWRESREVGTRFETPAVDLGHPAVNIGLGVEVPRNRWVLLAWGPALGPAVLFWGVLAVVIGLAFALGRLRITPLGMGQWALLGVGLTQAPPWAAVLVVGWLLALGARARAPVDMPALRFNLMQLGLGLLTLTALALLLEAVRQGLLGQPEMQIAGNGSSGRLLRWYQDRSGPPLPRAGLLSVPLWAYRLLMLAWALWLAFALLGWLRWGWECFRAGALWRPVRLPRGRPGTA